MLKGMSIKTAGILAGIRTASFRPCFSNDSDGVWRDGACSEAVSAAMQQRFQPTPVSAGLPADCRPRLSCQVWIDRYWTPSISTPSAWHNLLPGKKGRISDLLCEILPLSFGNLPCQPVLCISVCSFCSLVLVLATVKTSLRCHARLTLRQNGLKFVCWI